MTPIEWISASEVPPHVAAVMAALRFDEPSASALERLSAAEWDACLAFCDQAGLTLLLGDHARNSLPDVVRERVIRNRHANETRLRRLEADYLQIASQLHVAGIDHVVLKGFSHEPDFAPKRGLRPQYGIDLFFRPTNVLRAHDIIADLGYHRALRHQPTNVDHVPAMVRLTSWRWAGDYFDAGIPAAVELHYRTWDERAARLRAPGADQFWQRRTVRELGAATIPVFQSIDQLGYACLEALRRLLRGNLKAFEVYELGYFLQRGKEKTLFWGDWQRVHEPALRALECVPLLLARRWFGCVLPPAVAEEAARLPPGVEKWLERFAASPLAAATRPNKDELWLHLSLVRRIGDRARVLGLGLAPPRIAEPLDGMFAPLEERSVRARLENWLRWWGNLGQRLQLRFRTYQALLSGAVTWWA